MQCCTMLVIMKDLGFVIHIVDYIVNFAYLLFRECMLGHETKCTKGVTKCRSKREQLTTCIRYKRNGNICYFVPVTVNAF